MSEWFAGTFCLTLAVQCCPIHICLEYCHQDNFLCLLFWAVSTVQGYLLDHVKYKHKHLQFLDTSHLLFPHHVLLDLEKTAPFSSSGSLEPASVLSFQYFMSTFLLVLFIPWNLSDGSPYPSIWNTLVLEGVLCLSIWPVFYSLLSFSHLPKFVWFWQSRLRC